MNKHIDFKDWVINQITKYPNITFGSLHRDACYSRDIKYNSHDGSLLLTLKKLISEKVITEKNKNNNSFYNLGTQLLRDDRLNILLEECRHVRGDIIIKDGKVYAECKKCGKLY